MPTHRGHSGRPAPLPVSRLRRRCLAPALLLLAATPLQAAIFTVGTGAGCTHPTIQLAINAAEASAGADTVRVTRTMAWTQQALQVNTSQDLNLVGGFATCNQAATDNLTTTISGAGGATEPVLRISAGTGSTIRLRHLFITGGDEDSGGYGGGIYYRGDGVLELIEMSVSNNIAGYGGGIYAEGTGTAAELILGPSVTVANNTARGSGGGIYVDSLEMTMMAPGSILALNVAQGVIGGGFGGGLLVNSIDYTANADVASTGQGDLGAVFGNEAVFGGGIAAVASNTEGRLSRVYVFSAAGGAPLRIRNNRASGSGGALFAKGEGAVFDGAEAQLYLNYVHLEGNRAPEGAVASLVGGQFNGALLTLTDHPFDGGAPCPVGRPCNTIVDNRSLDGDDLPTFGNLIGSVGRTSIVLAGARISGNHGGRLLRSAGGSDDTTVRLDDVQVTDNETTLELMQVTGGEATLEIVDSTLAGNIIPLGPVLAVVGDVDLRRSILWHPDRTTLQFVGSAILVSVLASEADSLGGGAQVLVAPPRFLDPARGDYGLRAASPAVDMALANPAETLDLHRRPRDVDLPFKANGAGPRDVGALERPALQPLVINADFDLDLNLWPALNAGAGWTNADNSTGAAGSGSVLVQVAGSTAPGNRLVTLRQCIHLPGPGSYRLNGWGRSSPGGTVFERDGGALAWEYRQAGGESCNAGAATASGELLLGNSQAWNRPASPAVIQVPVTGFSATSSITVSLVVIDNGLQLPRSFFGRFDGITLDIDGDLIFANGFQP
jgi:predicted outer membrane repeat protein